MSERKSVDAIAVSLMVFFCICLGLQQVALKAVANDISPVFQIALRSGIAALLVTLYLCFQRQPLQWRGGYWKAGMLAGTLFALEYLFLGEALLYTSASHAVVFLYAAPVFSALILHFKILEERMTPLQWVGIVTAFAGIAIAFLGSDSGNSPRNLPATLWGDALALLAAVAWGATTVVIRVSYLSVIPAAQTLLYQLIAGFVLLILAALLMGQVRFEPTPLALGSLAFQAIIISFLCYLIWFWLLRHYQASRIGALSFMSPLCGVGFGAWLLAEPIEPGFTLGASLVMLGIVLVNGASWLQVLWARTFTAQESKHIVQLTNIVI